VHKPTNQPAFTAPETESPPRPWDIELGDLLIRAAMLCVEQGLDVETFMKGAWSAYVEAWHRCPDEQITQLDVPWSGWRFRVGRRERRLVGWFMHG